MGTLFIKVIEISVAASFLMLAVILLRIPLKKAPKWFMGVLWAIVALRLIFPFQFEASIGFIPNIGDRLETFFYGNNESDSITYTYFTDHDYEMGTNEIVTHEYTPNESVITEPDSEGIDYLPNEQIIIEPIQGQNSDLTMQRRDFFIRLQMIWLFGILVILAYAVFSYISIRKKTRESIKLDNENNVFVCDEIETPFILGVFKPVIYIPSGLDDETIRNVLAHEKAHIKRLDYLRKQFGFLILALHWFNPLVWISYALFCRDIELACDEKVISRMSLDEKKSYANSLLLCSTHKRLVLAYPLAFGEVGVGTRVKQIFNYRKPTFWLIVMLAIVCAGLSTSFFTSASKEKDVSDASSSTDASIVMTKDRFIDKWCEDFRDRNVLGIINASTDEVQRTLTEEGLLDTDGDNATFGWSSPWPGLNPDANRSCAYTYTDDDRNEVEIFFCAIDSEPHVYLWKEYITVGKDENGDYKVVSEEFIRYEELETSEDYENAWDASGMLMDALDYTQNGLGEYLNRNAKDNTGANYKKLFDPITAARYLLNLSEDEAKVTLSIDDSSEIGCVVAVKFNDSNFYTNVVVVQPWGTDGIYIPVEYQPDESIIGVFESDEHEYITGDGGFGELPNAKGDEAKWIDLKYASVSDYFENVHEHVSMEDGYELGVDLDIDGHWDHIVTEDLGYNGGDGGYLPHVYRGNEEIPLPIDAESLPYAILWGEDKVELFQDDVCIAELSWDEIKQIYLNKGFTEAEYENLKSNLAKDAWIKGDSASGFVVKGYGGKRELIIKFYMQGMGGHADTLGYYLMHLTLNSDDTWNQERSEFVLDM
jgi:beta-lactamase regulating signal transducer with metallopeptidase domain